MSGGRPTVTDVTLASLPNGHAGGRTLPVALDLATLLIGYGVTTIDMGTVDSALRFELAHHLGLALPSAHIMARSPMNRRQISHVREALKTCGTPRLGMIVPTRPDQVLGERWPSYLDYLSGVEDYVRFASRLGLAVDLLLDTTPNIDAVFIGRLARQGIAAGARGVVLTDSGSAPAGNLARLISSVIQAVGHGRVGVRCSDHQQTGAMQTLVAAENGAAEVSAVAAPWMADLPAPPLAALAAVDLFPLTHEEEMLLSVRTHALLGGGPHAGFQAAAGNQ